MTSGFITIIVAILILGVLYFILQKIKGTKDKGQDKLINRNVPPYEPDNKAAGGGHDEMR